MLKSDYDVNSEDIQELKNPDAVAGFFAKLGYNTNKRIDQNPEHLGITNRTLQDQIKKIERIAENGSLRIYHLELKNVTMANTLQISRSLKEMAGFFLLVITSDYERIDFVLLEQVIPLGKKKKITGKPSFTLRPRVLTVERTNLDNVSRRVLRRFTFTESDEFAQYDKIKSAYTIADWAEDFFNNRALFSDYFLMNRLKEDDVWKEKPEKAYFNFKKKIKPISSIWNNKNENEFQEKFIEPSLKALGFNYKRIPRKSNNEIKPHYILNSTNGNAKIGGVLAYIWNRNLDAKDYTRDNENPEENPSQAVVTILVEENIPWVIVTNGKIWRLYTSKAHSRATNYYEIDLEETIALDDPNEAFRYFWLLFRVEAFIPQTILIEGGVRKDISFLDKILKESKDYSKELEERLKARVFEEVFPFFAEGFITNMGGSKTLMAIPDEEKDTMYKELFEATLTILYKLLFLLYAESRNLLPIKETRGYFVKSITKLKKDIFKKGGDIADEVSSKLLKNYSKNKTNLYDRILELSQILDDGNSSLNVPKYNGGLFLSKVIEYPRNREEAIAKFLNNNKIPDYYLARGLDLLSRDEDPKKLSLVPIDYKSLGVRQLGSIYEGLLEFNIEIAKEKMAIVKSKKSEIVIPYRNAIKNQMKIATIKKGQKTVEATYPKGKIYIVNSNKERKASGSYYTPDYIVKYIVKSTIDPLLENKFNILRPKLQKLKPNQLETDEANEIVEELFNIHILDPAMGSGHFMVETVDYLTDKMLDFLNGFPNNPIQLELQKTRETILDEMSKQNVNIDHNKLIDVSLMKRYILKRCVYGVDLNPMAVELAKVSLWLDCFTLGAPLSFLDHHLKCGDSLLGTNLRMVESEIEFGQMTLGAEGKFGGIEKATRSMINIGKLSDITSDMIEKSKIEFDNAKKEIEPYKKMLNIYISQSFSNKPLIKKRGKKVEIYSSALEFLRSKEIDLWLKDSKITSNLSEKQKEIIAATDHDYENWNFFHWDIEFPEIFLNSKKGTYGFDVVIGNPPYVMNTKLMAPLKEWLKITFNNIYHGQNDICYYFIARALELQKENGYSSYIVSRYFIESKNAQRLRDHMLNNGSFVEIIDFRNNQIFGKKVNVLTLIFNIKKNKKRNSFNSYILKDNLENQLPDILKTLNASKINIMEKYEIYKINPKSIDNRPWNFKKIYNTFRFESDKKNFKEIGECNFLSICKGMETGLNNIKDINENKLGVLMLSKREVNKLNIENDVLRKVIKGQDIKNYFIDFKNRYIIYLKPKDSINKFPKTKSHLLKYKKLLEKRFDFKNGNCKWYSMGNLRNCEIFDSKIERIYVPTYSKKHVFGYDSGQDDNFFYGMTDTYIIAKTSDNYINLKYLLALLNSDLIKNIHRNIAKLKREGYYEYTKNVLEKLPIRLIFNNTPLKDKKKNLQALKTKYKSYLKSKESVEILLEVRNYLPIDNEGLISEHQKTDVIHDFLIILVDEIISKQKSNKKEYNRFINWLSNKLNIDSDLLNEIKAVDEYYNTSFDKFIINIKNINPDLKDLLDNSLKQQIKNEYEISRKKILDENQIINITKNLIDEIIYILYHLSEKEIITVKKE